MIKLCKIPTGIKTFDININGGFPAGSVILLLEDVGAGAREFIYTSIFNITRINHDSCLKKDFEKGDCVFPNKICYISISKSKDDILNENLYAFQKGFYEALNNGLIFKELSDVYYRSSIVQSLWISDDIDIDDYSGKDNSIGILKEISAFIKKNAKDNVVVIDSLTDIMMHENGSLNKNNIVMFLKGMTRTAKSLNCLIYLILGANILERNLQEIITDVVDGVLVFEWAHGGGVKMQRNLYVSKFRGLMPQLEQNKIAKFDTKITSSDGFEVSNIRKII